MSCSKFRLLGEAALPPGGEYEPPDSAAPLRAVPLPEEREEELVHGAALSPDAGEAAGEAVMAAPAPRVAVRHARALRRLLRLVLKVRKE